ncbi:hypothetical protein BPOR_1628g00010 [Botrytis porri]|uniref:Uncharacterized protein n=1 Tax=Botrytis porri TaxID=87229 RepID=A0A4Z1K5B9_9HELO|nr:hypothetical protein BPOR_1628g00010 [Botrytis porri]
MSHSGRSVKKNGMSDTTGTNRKQNKQNSMEIGPTFILSGLLPPECKSLNSTHSLNSPTLAGAIRLRGSG